MTELKISSQVTVRCPGCGVMIERVTGETMVYCIACRKWCREIADDTRVATAPAAPPPKLRRRIRCH